VQVHHDIERFSTYFTAVGLLADNGYCEQFCQIN